ncbi:hypothetical protein [uncultured Polaribacter sp.]|jgi:Mn-dependent DtxR family transcriptional regulator|uniref:hypothetical protein n=1 Tax=uncultured Polaribacter sp. TaxID=174711 RepID=UPI003703EEF6
MDVIITFNKQIVKNKSKHPYTKIEFVEKDLKVSRITAANYLNTLSDDGILTKNKSESRFLVLFINGKEKRKEKIISSIKL